MALARLRKPSCVSLPRDPVLPTRDRRLLLGRDAQPLAPPERRTRVDDVERGRRPSPRRCARAGPRWHGRSRPPPARSDRRLGRWCPGHPPVGGAGPADPADAARPADPRAASSATLAPSARPRHDRRRPRPGRLHRGVREPRAARPAAAEGRVDHSDAEAQRQDHRTGHARARERVASVLRNLVARPRTHADADSGARLVDEPANAQADPATHVRSGAAGRNRPTPAPTPKPTPKPRSQAEADPQAGGGDHSFTADITSPAPRPNGNLHVHRIECNELQHCLRRRVGSDSGRDRRGARPTLSSIPVGTRRADRVNGPGGVETVSPDHRCPVGDGRARGRTPRRRTPVACHGPCRRRQHPRLHGRLHFHG